MFLLKDTDSKQKRKAKYFGLAAFGLVLVFMAGLIVALNSEAVIERVDERINPIHVTTETVSAIGIDGAPRGDEVGRNELTGPGAGAPTARR